MNDKIECKGGVTFLNVEVFGECAHLNPFSINTDQIRYLREYYDDNGKCVGWAIVVGQKMYPTRELNFDHIKIGETITIGGTMFECCKTTTLTQKEEYKTLINYKNVLYVRKYLKDRKSGDKTPDKSDNFAIITVDDRVIPLITENGSETIS